MHSQDKNLYLMLYAGRGGPHTVPHLLRRFYLYGARFGESISKPTAWRWLRRATDQGLIEKRDDGYKTTDFGEKLLTAHIAELVEHVDMLSKIEMFDGPLHMEKD